MVAIIEADDPKYLDNIWDKIWNPPSPHNSWNEKGWSMENLKEMELTMRLKS